MRKPSPLLLKRCKFGEIISCMAAGCFSSTLIPYRSEGISARHTARPSSCCSEVAPNQTPPSAIKQGLLSWKALTVHPIKPPKPGPCRLVAGVHKAVLTACLTQGLVARARPALHHGARLVLSTRQLRQHLASGFASKKNIKKFPSYV